MVPQQLLLLLIKMVILQLLYLRFPQEKIAVMAIIVILPQVGIENKMLKLMMQQQLKMCA
jgi:hypothetical protein